MARHVEDADVRVASGDAPQVAPLAVPLELLGELAFRPLEVVGLRGRHVMGQANIHFDLEQHDQALPIFGMLCVRSTGRSRRKKSMRSSSSSMPRPGLFGTFKVKSP